MQYYTSFFGRRYKTIQAFCKVKTMRYCFVNRAFATTALLRRAVVCSITGAGICFWVKTNYNSVKNPWQIMPYECLFHLKPARVAEPGAMHGRRHGGLPRAQKIIFL